MSIKKIMLLKSSSVPMVTSTCLYFCFFTLLRFAVFVNALWIAVVCFSVALLAQIPTDYVFVYPIFCVSVSGQRSLSIFLFSCARCSLTFVFLTCPGSVYVACCYIGWIPEFLLTCVHSRGFLGTPQAQVGRNMQPGRYFVKVVDVLDECIYFILENYCF